MSSTFTAVASMGYQGLSQVGNMLGQAPWSQGAALTEAQMQAQGYTIVREWNPIENRIIERVIPLTKPPTLPDGRYEIKDSKMALMIIDDPIKPEMTDEDVFDEAIKSKPLFGEGRGYNLRGNKHLLDIK